MAWSPVLGQTALPLAEQSAGGSQRSLLPAPSQRRQRRIGEKRHGAALQMRSQQPTFTPHASATAVAAAPQSVSGRMAELKAEGRRALPPPSPSAPSCCKPAGGICLRTFSRADKLLCVAQRGLHTVHNSRRSGPGHHSGGSQAARRSGGGCHRARHPILRASRAPSSCTRVFRCHDAPGFHTASVLPLGVGSTCADSIFAQRL